MEDCIVFCIVLSSNKREQEEHCNFDLHKLQHWHLFMCWVKETDEETQPTPPERNQLCRYVLTEPKVAALSLNNCVSLVKMAAGQQGHTK